MLLYAPPGMQGSLLLACGHSLLSVSLLICSTNTAVFPTADNIPRELAMPVTVHPCQLADIFS